MNIKLQLIHVISHCLHYRWKLSIETQYYVVLFGALHIEQSFLGIHADLINGSGLFEIMNHLNFNIGLTAKADVSSINRARYSMQVT